MQNHVKRLSSEVTLEHLKQKEDEERWQLFLFGFLFFSSVITVCVLDVFLLCGVCQESQVL